MDISELRQFLKCLQAQNAQSEAELNLLAQNTNSFSPVAANLSANINAAAQMDAQQVTTLVNTLLSNMETRLLFQMKQEVLAVFQQNSTPQSPNGSCLSAASSGSQVSTGPQGVCLPPGPQPFNGISASPSAGGHDNSTFAATVLNKAVEVDQRKLRNPELTPIALRRWKLAYNIYASDPHKRMKISDAFGEESLRCLGLMFSDYPVPLDDAGFDAYLKYKFLKSSHVFSDIKTVVSKIKLATPLSVESLQAYHSDFCRALTPLLDEIQLQNTSPDLHVTLIKAFYDGIP